MRILATGAAGFIGSNFVRRVANGFYPEITDVIVLDKLTYAGRVENLKSAESFSGYSFVKGDICDPLIIQSLLKKVDAVVNFAAESHVDRSIKGAAEFITTNILGVQNILESICNSNRSIRFLQVSTDEVYGSIEMGSWKEDSPLMPNSPYSASKAGAELIARSYLKTHELDLVITRCSNNYGSYHFPEKLIPLFVTNIIEGKKIPIYGNGSNIRDWLHVDDHCDALYEVLLKGISGETYNIGGGNELSNLEITQLILEIMGADESVIQYVDDRKGHDFRYSVDWYKIRNSLNYTPKVEFHSGLLSTIEWYKKNENWWKALKN